jgi:hypothetical protein
VAGPVCPACGHGNTPGSRFCSSCGTALTAAAVEHPTDVLVIEGTELDAATDVDRSLFPSDVGLLVVQHGPKSGSRYVLDVPVVSAGRHPDSEIFLDDVTVSRRHAEILRVGDRYVVRDVGSLNGTYVNRRLVEEATLEDGDELQIGRFKLVFLHGTRG